MQNVQTFELFNPNQTPVLANLEATDILLTLTSSLDIGNEQSPRLHEDTGGLWQNGF